MRAFKVSAAIVVAGIIGAACSSGGDSDSSAERARTAPESTEEPAPTTTETPAGPVDPAAAAAEVEANVEKYFDSETPQEEAFPLAEDIDEIKDTLLQAAATSPGGHRTVDVRDVSFTGATEATYTFDLLIEGNVLLPDNIGTAVFEDGVWKVSRETNCGLTALAGFSCPEATPAP